MRILTTADFSDASDDSCSTAARLARATDSTLVVAHIFDETQNASNDRYAIAYERLERLRVSLADDGLDVRGVMLRGSFNDALTDYVRKHYVDLAILDGLADAARDARVELAEHLECAVMMLGNDRAGLIDACVAGHRMRVLAAVDRTESSDAALGWLRRLRSCMACDVTLFYGYWPPDEHVRLGIPLPADIFEPDFNVVSTLERELGARAADLGGKGELRILCRPGGSRAEELIESAAAVTMADLIIVGSHHRRGWQRLTRGSVSRQLLRSSGLPVVCVGHDLYLRRTAPLRRVLVATDLSDAGNHAIDAAYDLLGDSAATVDIVHVSKTQLSTMAVDGLLVSMRALIPAAIDQERVTTHVHVLQSGPVADAVLQAANRWNVDAICLGARTSDGLVRKLQSSVAAEVVERASCPVLVARARPA